MDRKQPDGSQDGAVHDRGPGEPPLQQSISDLCRRLGVADLYVFGSRAREIVARVRNQALPGRDERPTRDADVGVRPLAGVFLGVDALVDLATALERLLEVPRVDVVLLPKASPFLALDAVRGELLFCADPDDQAEFELYVLRRAGDLAPFQRFRQELALSRYPRGES
jgi:uncharacterized protein